MLELTEIILGLLIVVSVAQCGQWYQFRALRNPGLNTSTVANSDACISACLSATGCSAISYQPTSSQCTMSFCNSLDLYINRGWHTYVIVGQLIENLAVAAPQFEWMLTDTCGSANLGTAAGPDVNLFNTNYTSSQSVYAGRAVNFLGVTTSKAVSNTSTAIFNPMGNNSLSVMMWVRWTKLSDYTAAFLEFDVGTTTRGMIYWWWGGGLYYVSYGRSACPVNCGQVSYTFTPVINTWYHVAYVYDGTNGLMKLYINGTIVDVEVVQYIRYTTTVWNTVYIGASPYDAAGTMNGNLYCYKVFNAALMAIDIKAYGDSCSTGKVRLS